MENLESVCSHITLHGNSMLVCLESKATTLQLSNLVSLNLKDPATMQNPTLKSLFKDLGQADRIIVKLSETVMAEHPNIKLGDSAIFNNYSQPISFINTEDKLDLENVINDYKYDSKGKTDLNKIGISYPIHAYYIYEAQFLIVTQPPLVIEEKE